MLNKLLTTFLSKCSFIAVISYIRISDMSKDSNKDSWSNFLDLCLDIKTPEDMNNLLKLFLTIEEERAISNRYLIIKHLLDGKKSQREISKDIGVSNSALTRGSNGLKIIDSKFKEYLIEKMK